jgi:hypothetical protein
MPSDTIPASPTAGLSGLRLDELLKDFDAAGAALAGR